MPFRELTGWIRIATAKRRQAAIDSAIARNKGAAE